jgi:hypothetical protein
VLATATPIGIRPDTETILMQLLAEKQARATESIFRLLGMSHPAEDFERIYRGLHGNRLDRASGLELLESVVRPTARETVLALLDDSADPARLARIAGSEVHLGLTHDETLTAIIRASTGVLQAVAVQHAAAVGLVSMQ